MFFYRNSEHLTKTPMKNVLKLAFVLAFVVGCQDPEPKFKPSQFSETGAFHNNGLDFILTSLQEKRKLIQASGEDGKLTMDKLLQFSQDAATRYLVQEGAGLSSEQLKLVIEKSDVITKKLSECLLKKTEKNGRTADAADDIALELRDALLAEVAPELSNAQLEILNDIFVVLEVYDGDNNSIQSHLNAIADDVMYNLPGSEQPAMYEAIAVARSSSQYWSQNYAAWQEEINQIVSGCPTCNPIPRTAVPGKGYWIAGADVVGGLLMAGICYGVGPVGWGFAFKAVGAAASVASAATGAIVAGTK